MTDKEIYGRIASAEFAHLLKSRLGVPEECVEEERARYRSAVEGFCRLYGEDRDIHLFSVGGRSEISGNHTDHNNGRVIAAAVHLSIIAVAAAREDGVIRLKSEGFDEDIVTSGASEEAKSENFGKSAALIAGCRRAFRNKGLREGGFDAYTVSNVLKGSGLSSSAAFEVAVCKILSYLYNGDAVEEIELAKMSRYAENVFFGKPCGLMDQAACAVGGFIAVDFENEDAPGVENIDFDLASAGYALCITDTGGSHADLTADYAAIPAEMKDVAAFFGKEKLRELDGEIVIGSMPELRAALGDRAVLRAMHFFDENERVEEQTAAVKAGDAERFLALVEKSGRSSFSYLQNVTAAGSAEQGVALALYFSEKFFAEKGIPGACRVHGGGFAGTAQAFVPLDCSAEYLKYMEKIFGGGSCHILGIRKAGAECLA